MRGGDSDTEEEDLTEDIQATILEALLDLGDSIMKNSTKWRQRERSRPREGVGFTAEGGEAGPVDEEASEVDMPDLTREMLKSTEKKQRAILKPRTRREITLRKHKTIDVLSVVFDPRISLELVANL